MSELLAKGGNKGVLLLLPSESGASMSIIGLGAAFILYSTGLLIWLDGRKVLSDDLSRTSLLMPGFAKQGKTSLHR
jgi:hypothetical protein